MVWVVHILEIDCFFAVPYARRFRNLPFEVGHLDTSVPRVEGDPIVSLRGF